MFVVVGRFRFHPMEQEERQGMIRGWDQDFAPMARGSRGFRSAPSCNSTLCRTWRSRLSA